MQPQHLKDDAVRGSYPTDKQSGEGSAHQSAHFITRGSAHDGSSSANNKKSSTYDNNELEGSLNAHQNISTKKLLKSIMETDSAKPSVEPGPNGRDTLSLSTSAATVPRPTTSSTTSRKPPTVESLREAYNSHLLHSQMSRQLPVRRKSRLDRQVLQDSPPVVPPSKPIAKDFAFKDGGVGVPIATPGPAYVPTPSYPFPVMSHRMQMTSMSPTGFGPQDRTLPSGTNTPASVIFFPTGTNPSTPFENPDFPSPNLYELALMLHSEPGLEGFWAIIVRIMRDFYMAERISLTIPTDLTDLENSPWGQKANFNDADEDALSLTYMDEDDMSTPLIRNNNQLGQATRAGTDKNRNVAVPSAPLRMASQDSLDPVVLTTDDSSAFSPITVDVSEKQQIHEGGWAPTDGSHDARESLHQLPETLPEYSLDPFGQMEKEGQSRGRVFLNLQPLNYEAEPLIDGAGVSRVLERGKTVVLSREYKDMQSKWERLAAQKEERAKTKEQKSAGSFNEDDSEHMPNMSSFLGIVPGDSMAAAMGGKARSRKRFPVPAIDEFQLRYRDTPRGNSPPKGPIFEEYEQTISSPWSQSPAPSPAIRSDPTENPFFAPAKVDEDSFNPSIESPHYSISEPINAIGLENTSTVIHVPLIHPSTSIIGFGKRRQSTLSQTAPEIPEKRTPIAILSILSPVIPFPSNLVHSLSHLSPLMATAFALSQAHQNATLQVSNLQFHESKGIEGAQKNSSGSMSVSSPSDYTKSTSTTNSIAGTPNPDLNLAFGLGATISLEPSSRSPMYSPASKTGSGADSYFTVRQGRPLSRRRQSSGVYQVPQSPGEVVMTSKAYGGSRIDNLRDEATGRPARPAISRGISEVMNSAEVSKPEKQEESDHSESVSDSERGESLDDPPSDDMQTPKAMLSPRTDMTRQSTGFFGPAKMGRIEDLNIDLSSVPITHLFSKPDYVPLPTPSPLQVSPTVPATPSHVPLPETPLYGPSTMPENFAQASMARRAMAPGYIKLTPPTLSSLAASHSSLNVSTPLVHPSATGDLQAVESLLEASSYPLPSPVPGLLEDPSESSHESQDGKSDIKRKVPIRRITSAHSTYKHTRLHSHGAEYTASFPTLTTPSAVPPTPGYDKSRHGTARTPYSHPHENQRNMPPPSNKLLRTIIDAIPVHVFTAAPHTGETTWVNSRMLSYRGSTAEELMVDPYEPFHPDDRANYVRLWLVAVRKGEPFSYQIRIRRFDGCYRWFMIRAVPLRDNRGIIVHWFGTNMDIHDQRIAEVSAARQAEMAESEAKYRSLANSSPQIVFAATASAGITFANNQWLEYSGQTLDQALQLGFMEFVHPIDRQKCALPGFRVERTDTDGKGKTQSAWFKPADQNETATVVGETRKVEFAIKKDNKEAQPPFSTELRLRRSDGEYRWHLVRCVSVEASNVEGLWFGTCTDINDHKLLEQRLKDANDAARKAMESKTRFLSNMSHEIRTPLIGISGMVNFLLDTPLNGEQLDYCHTISSSSDGLLMVINDILDLSKVEAGMMRLSFEWFRVRSLVEDANELLSTMAISKELELNYLIEDDVPSMVSGDRIRLRQVILNIVGNAIKFTSKGEVFTRCFVIKDAKPPKDTIMLGFECHDTGPGFGKQDEELMFKPFSQIDGSSTRAHGGSGLGLVISRQLVELHGGKMTATSVKGEGSTFYFSALCKTPVLSVDKNTSPGSEETTPVPLPGHRHLWSSGDISLTTPPALVHSPGTPSSTVASSAGSSYPPPIDSDSTRIMSQPITSAQDPSSMKFSLPDNVQEKVNKANPDPFPKKKTAGQNPIVPKSLPPVLFSILILSFLPFSRLALESHISTVLPKNIPQQITVIESTDEAKNLIGGPAPIVFTHLVINVPSHTEIAELTQTVHDSPQLSSTTMVVLTTPVHRTAIIEERPALYEAMGARVQFIYKPIKPSRLSVIFDPDQERDASMDRYRHTAQQVVDSQKAVFSNMQQEVGNRGHKVLLVEDNLVNQKVLLRFLGRVGLEVETATDGEECVGKVFENTVGYYGLILCDLHMPRKDGFAACSEIRQWEQEKQVQRKTPIVALSANVMSDVAERCATAGFSRYVSKPVDFKVLGDTIKVLLDTSKDPGLMSDFVNISEGSGEKA